MNALQIFNYQNEAISFKSENGTTYVNATEMAKSFNKVSKDWMRLKQAQEFISSLSSVRQISPSQLVIVQKGNSSDFQQGTWMHEDVAIEFSRWLSPSFAIWCNDRIKELMKHGMTATTETAERLLNDPDFLIETLTALKSEREQKAILLEQTRLQQKEIALVQPKVHYFDNVLQSTSVYVADQIAKELGMTAITMNRLLVNQGVLIRRNGQLVLTAKYANKGYTKPRTYSFTKNDGTSGTHTTTTYTEQGRKFLHSVFGN